MINKSIGKLKILHNKNNNFNKFWLRTIQKSDDSPSHSVKQNFIEKTPITAQLWQLRKSHFDKEVIKYNNNENYYYYYYY